MSKRHGLPKQPKISNTSSTPVSLDELERDAGKGIPSEVDEADLSDDPLSGIGFGMSLMEQLFVGIIKANPVTKKAGHRAVVTDRQRLDDAMVALFGRKSSKNPMPGDRDDEALLWMRNEEHARFAKGAKVSDRSLAIDATAKFYGNDTNGGDRSTSDRLREKYSGVYWSKQDKGRKTEAKKTWDYRLFEHDYIVESLEAKALRDIAERLSAFGVAVTLGECKSD